MLHVLEHSLLDSLKLFPWLLLIYIVIELLERKTDLTGKDRLNGKLGPLVGSATGLIPQCGFSVMAAKLYEQKFVTIGTLVAIFLSTSDEAFVILLSSGTGAVHLLPFIAAKIFIGVSVGYATDAIVRAFTRKKQPLVTADEGGVSATKPKSAKDMFFEREANKSAYECTSCGRPHEVGKPLKNYFFYPLLHSLQVLLFIFLVNFALGSIVHFVTEERFAAFMERSIWVQPCLTTLVGLIPNCASSVVLTEGFLQGAIQFGSCVAGLCANAGLGFVVLLKNTKKWKRKFALIAFVYLISVFFGYLINGAQALLF